MEPTPGSRQRWMSSTLQEPDMTMMECALHGELAGLEMNDLDSHIGRSIFHADDDSGVGRSVIRHGEQDCGGLARGARRR